MPFDRVTLIRVVASALLLGCVKADQKFVQGQTQKEPTANSQFSKAEREALVLLGNCMNSQVTATSAGSNVTDEVVTLLMSSTDETGKILRQHEFADALPKAVGYLASREPKGRIQELLVLCSKNPTIVAIKEVLGNEKSRNKRGVLIYDDLGAPLGVDTFKNDPRIFPVERPLLWYDYGMLKFGVVDDKVQVLSVDFQKSAQSQPAKDK